MTDTSYSSLWLFEKKPIDGLVDTMARDEGLSEFNPSVAGKIIRYWSGEEDIILDPFAGRTRAVVAMLHLRHYIGFEVSGKAYSALVKNISQERFEDLPQPIIHHDDSNNINKYHLPEVDLVFTCPPYWNLEKYESVPGQLSDIGVYETFLGRLQTILSKANNSLKPHGYFILMVGDWRENNRYYDFHTDCIKMMRKIGLYLWDIIINQSVTFDLACKRFGNLRKSRKTAKVHEYILVFKKG